MDGVDAVPRRARGAGGGRRTLACSSAGGGLRLAVVGYEREVTAEAGHRVGLSAGARVVHVAAGPMDGAGVAALRRRAPGRRAARRRHRRRQRRRAAAQRRASSPVAPRGPGRRRRQRRRPRRGRCRSAVGRGGAVTSRRRTCCRASASRRRGRAGRRSARCSSGTSSAARGSRAGPTVRRRWCAPRPRTPCSAGVEVLADGAGCAGAGDVLVVDVGGATTDVYSVVTPQGEDATLRREVVEVALARPHRRGRPRDALERRRCGRRGGRRAAGRRRPRSRGCGPQPSSGWPTRRTCRTTTPAATTTRASRSSP